MAMSSRSLFDTSTLQHGCCLATQQRRVRHIQGIAIRNLTFSHDVSQIKTYFSLLSSETKKAFYTSEIIQSSLNPTWKSLSYSYDSKIPEMSDKTVILRVYAGTNDVFRIIIELDIHLTCLQLLNKKVDVYEFAANTVIFSMFNEHFTIPPELPLSTTPCTNVLTTSITCDTSAVRNSYSINTLTRLKTVLRAIRQTQTLVMRHRHSIDDRLHISQQQRKHVGAVEKQVAVVEQLRGELVHETDSLLTARQAHNIRSQRLQASKVNLKDNDARLRKHKEELAEALTRHNQTREDCTKVKAALTIRRKQMISDLVTYIYPITMTTKGYSICNIHLPTSENLSSKDDPSVAVSLGYACHLLTIMSRLLDQPLWYAVHNNGSRSEIVDHVIDKLPYKDRKFPLFGKGKEKLQFDYGVFLLNKNVCQLRFDCGLGTNDLRPTLSNLYSFLEARFGVNSRDSFTAASKPQVEAVPTANKKTKSQSNINANLSLKHPVTSAAEITENGSPYKAVTNLSLHYNESVRFKDDVNSSDDDFKNIPTNLKTINCTKSIITEKHENRTNNLEYDANLEELIDDSETDRDVLCADELISDTSGDVSQIQRKLENLHADENLFNSASIRSCVQENDDICDKNLDDTAFEKSNVVDGDH